MSKNNNYKGIRTYHYQADVDLYAKQPDDYTGYITANMKDIKAAYKEFMQELILEAQEAY